MSFLAPVMLVGLVAALVPLIIHLVGRRRAPRRPFAAIDFVLRSNRRVAQRLRLRQWLLLALRVALVAAVVLMVAKPYAEVDSELPMVGAGPQSAVIVLDDTLSMRRRSSTRTLGHDAARRAQEIVTLLGGGADVAVLRVSVPDGPLPTLTRDTRKVRSAIAAVQPGYRHGGLGPAVAQAARLLRDSALPERHIYVLTDLALHGLAGVRGEVPADIRLHAVDVSGKGQAENRAVVAFTAHASGAPGQRSTALVAKVCNYGPAADAVKLSLEVDGRQAARGVLALGGWSCGRKRFQHSFPSGGVHQAVVALEPDALPEDDRRYLQVEIQTELRVLLVNGDPSPVRHRDELFYLETALAAGGVGGQAVSAKVVTVDDLERARLTSFDVVALCNVKGLAPPLAQQLEQYVNKGGGLFVALGEQVDAEAVNRTLGRLLPQPLRSAVSATAPDSGGSALRIGRVDVEHPIVAGIWSEEGGGGLRTARFDRVYRLSPATTADRRVILYYDDGSPALLEGRRGLGRVVLFTSTVDRDWTDLPIRPGYLPLVQQTIRYLSRAPDPQQRRALTVPGRYLLDPVPVRQHLRLVTPSGEEQSWTAKQLARRATLELHADQPGFYRLTAVSDEGRVTALERQSFAANVDPAESDLRKGTLQTSKVDGRRMARAKQRVELWHAVGVALLLLLLLESIFTRRG
ncbi:MAG: VWA domain-containing protein [Deltaproteobacteria bacterium]|nr:VWA domain-containing protein [Deltaproteobacteria bacterium]